MNIFPTRLLQSGNVFPCPLCRNGDGAGENRFCPACLERLRRIEEPHCPGCGGPLSGVLASCRKCLAEKPRPYLDAAALFDYRGDARELVQHFKNGAVELIRPCALELAELVSKRNWPIDCVAGVPLHWTRRLRRGYNQSELLGRLIARRLDLPCLPLLKRTAAGRMQKELSSAERHRNLTGLFHGDTNAVQGRVVLLVDDVLTTGATLSCAAAALRSAGAVAVYCAVVCRA